MLKSFILHQLNKIIKLNITIYLTKKINLNQMFYTISLLAEI